MPAIVLALAAAIGIRAQEPPDKAPPLVKAPQVKITSPSGGWSSDRIITAGGTISDADIKTVTLVVNGIPMTIRAKAGSFSAKLVLSPGRNTIQAVAENEAGMGRDSVSLYAQVPAKDLKITLTWDTDGTDVDLHVTDPAGEECFYEHKSTKAGGNLDVDVTDGFGPETFTLAQAARGKYLVKVKYYSSNSRAQTRCRLDVVLFEGTSRERRETHTLMLTRTNEKLPAAEVFVR